MQEVVERLQELRATVRWPHSRHRLTVKSKAIVVVILASSALNGQTVPLVLNGTPQEVVEGPYWINLQMEQRIPITGAAHVLEAPADRIHALHEHSFFVPVRPDKLQ